MHLPHLNSLKVGLILTLVEQFFLILEIIQIVLRPVGRNSPDRFYVTVLSLLVLLIISFHFPFPAILKVGCETISECGTVAGILIFLAEMLRKALFVGVLRLVPVL